MMAGHDGAKTIDLLSKSFTCKVFDMDKIPYSHSMIAVHIKFYEHYQRQIYDYCIIR